MDRALGFVIMFWATVSQAYSLAIDSEDHSEKLMHLSHPDKLDRSALDSKNTQVAIDKKGHVSEPDKLIRRESESEKNQVLAQTKVHDVKYYLVKSGHECNCEDEHMVTYGATSVQNCAEMVATRGGNFFAVGTGSQPDMCLWEKTTSEECTEGWEVDEYDFYAIGVPTEDGGSSGTSGVSSVSTNGGSDESETTTTLGVDSNGDPITTTTGKGASTTSLKMDDEAAGGGVDGGGARPGHFVGIVPFLIMLMAGVTPGL